MQRLKLEGLDDSKLDLLTNLLDGLSSYLPIANFRCIRRDAGRGAVLLAEWEDESKSCSSLVRKEVALIDSKYVIEIGVVEEIRGCVPDMFWDSLVELILKWCDFEARILDVSSSAGFFEAGFGCALFDIRNNLLIRNELFCTHVVNKIPEWDGNSIPFSMPVLSGESLVFTPWEGLCVVAIVCDGGVLLVTSQKKYELEESLTPRESVVVGMVVRGFTFKEIAGQLDVTVSTASTHLYNAYRKLGISKRSDLVKKMSAM